MGKEFAKFINTDEIEFKYAKGMRDIVGNEIHTYHEIFFFIGGEAKFISEMGTQRLLPFTTVVIPKETFHCFAVCGAEADYCRCVFNFENVRELEDIIEKKMKKILIAQDDEVTELFLKLRKLAEKQEGDSETNVLMKALFAQILVSLKEQIGDFLCSGVSPATSQLVKYINENIGDNLTVDMLAKRLHISESHLAHIFKRDLNISIHRYVLEKRLILASKKISAGIPALRVATECGFSDYSGFYRQYKKMFGISPRMNKDKN